MLKHISEILPEVLNNIKIINMDNKIKFRTWDNDQNQFYYFDLLTVPLIVSLGAPVMQFTGLLDEMGVAIYDGDDVMYEGKIWEVRTCEDFAGYEISRSLFKHGQNEREWFFCDIACCCRVVGNKFNKQQAA